MKRGGKEIIALLFYVLAIGIAFFSFSEMEND